MLVFADVAQLVEQHIRNVKVPSSIPGIGTTYKEISSNETRIPQGIAGFLLGHEGRCCRVDG
jgi:hypothetical protein